MIVDGQRLDDGALLTADVAVVGAGPAGIVIALSLADAGHRVLLVESGASHSDTETQRLGDTTGDDPYHAPMDFATQRAIGGASNLWGGRCVPFDPVDFEPREIVGSAKWPIEYADVEPFFQRACEWCVCGDAQFDANEIPGLAGRTIVRGFRDGEVLASSLERWSLPTRFGREYRRRLRQSADLTLVTKLTCTEIVCSASKDRVDHLAARTLDGRRATIRASKYVVACGGLESTRLLFASDRMHPGGLGNHSGHLGRWYMAHVTARIAEARFSTPPSETIYGHERDPTGVYVRRRFSFPQDIQRSHKLPNSVLWLVNPKLADATHGNPILSLVYLMLSSPLGHRFVAEAIRQEHIEAEDQVSGWPHVHNVLRNPLSALRFALAFGYGRYVSPGRKVPGFFVRSESNSYPLQYHGEHLPCYGSYVKPSPERDSMGMPRLETHLEFSDEDVGGALRAHHCLDASLRQQGLGHLEFTHGDSEAAVREQLVGGFHQAGTTRMSRHPDDGVLDEQLAVHGFDDLFVASSSAFVTSGQANSTFMVIALAVRLAAHLDRSLDAGGRKLSSQPVVISAWT
jgi:choline dehydrogenase-like flavoprotein